MEPILTLGKLTVTPFGLMTLAGAVAGALLSLRKKGIGPVLPWVIAGALIVGHMWWVFFCPPGYGAEIGAFSLMLRIWEGGYTLYGALAGGTLGALIGSRLAGLSFTDTLDALAPGACAALFFCRIGEYFTMQGFGEPVENEALQFFPVAFCTYQDGSYQEWNYAVWAWEALAALIILAALLIRERKARRGQQTVLFVTALGTSQILLEQMRRDDFVRLNPFVRLSQITALMTLIAVLVVLTVRRRPDGKRIAVSFGEVAVAALTIVFAEFCFEKPAFRVPLYLALTLTAAGFALMMLLWRGRRGIPAACAFCLGSAALLGIHMADQWMTDLWLLYGMIALAVTAMGVVILLNAGDRREPAAA